MLNSLHLKRSEDCNLNIIIVGKLNTEVNSYIPFRQTTILNEQNVSFPLFNTQVTRCQNYPLYFSAH
jgi:hypothetical protein